MNEAEKGPRIGNSMYAALAAGVVSVSALGVSIYEAWLMREQQAASVLPIVDFWTGYGGDHGYSVNVANKGLGPAFIRDIDVRVDGQEMENWTSVLVALVGQRVNHNESNLSGNVVAQGESGAMLSISDMDMATAVWHQGERVSMTLCFCSVFEECWQTDIANLNVATPRTERVQSCPSSPGSSF